MREHRLADDVADREDVRDIGAHLLVDRDPAAVADVYAGLLGRDVLSIRTPSHGEQHAVVGFGRGRAAAFGVLERRREALRPRLDLRDLRLEQDLLVALLDAARERLHDVGIGAGNEAVHELDDRHFAAERVVHRRHLEPDDAPADDEQAFGNLLELERAGRIHEAPIAIGQAGNARGLRAGGDDAVIERHRLDAVLGLDRQQVRRRELAAPLDHGDLALLGHGADAAGQLAHHAVLELAQPVDIGLRRAELHAERSHLLGIGDHARGVQQRLGRNAADVEAHAAERRIAFDEDHFLAEVGRAESGGVATGTRAEHEHFGVHVRVEARERRAQLVANRLCALLRDGAFERCRVGGG